MAEARSSGAFSISEEPLISSSPASDTAADIDFTKHRGGPLLVALPRNPRELFVCWSVDWSAEFAEGEPVDRQVYIRVHAPSEEKSVVAEPMRGSVVVKELEPGKTYQVELGYFAPSRQWQAIADGHEVMMPLEQSTEDSPVEYATLPLHLTFQRVFETLGRPPEAQIMPALAKLQKRASDNEDNLTSDEKAIFDALGMAREELLVGAQQRMAAVAAPPIRPSRTSSGASSPAAWPS